MKSKVDGRLLSLKLLLYTYLLNFSSLSLATKEDLIGDFTRPFALPLTPGKHSDLKSITSDTLAKLLNGDYDDTIGSYKIIDCR